MNFELIALDLDGTLTDPEKNIPETTMYQKMTTTAMKTKTS